MLYGFNMAEWRAEEQALPRFCADQTGALSRLREILTKDEPAGENERRPYIVAAKILYMFPQADGEQVDSYLLRVGDKIREKCR